MAHPGPPLESPLTTNKSVERSHTPQETATDCGYVGLQANVLTVGLFANKYRIFSNIIRVFLQGKQSIFRHIDLYSSHSISASDHVFFQFACNYNKRCFYAMDV